MKAAVMSDPLEDVVLPARTEVEVAANAVWALFDAGLIEKRPELVQRAALVAGLTVDDLRLASLRRERVVARRLVPRPTVTRPEAPAFSRRSHPLEKPALPPVAYLRQQIPQRGDRQSMQQEERTKLTPAGMRGAAEAIFAHWRVRGNLECTRCGKPIESGCDAVVTAAHHETCP